MKQKKRIRGSGRHAWKIAVVFVLAAAWCIRFATLASSLDRRKPTAFTELTYENTGEWVPFGDNYYGKDYLRGFWFQARGSKIYTPEEYAKKLEAQGTPVSEMCRQILSRTYMIYEVEAGIKNEGHETGQIRFLPLDLIGRDFVASVNTEILSVVNGYQEDTIGVEIAQGSETTVLLPYILLENVTYREKPGRTLESEPLWIRLTAYPERVQVRVQ